MKYQLSEIARICGGRLHGSDITVCAVLTDSRDTSRTEEVMFVAINGANHDGHDYVQSLAQRGIRAFMVERMPHVAAVGCGYVEVENSLAALQRLAADYRSRYGGRVVAVTGSNGKTIVKEWTAQLVPPSYRMFRSPRSYNSQLGVALSLLMADAADDAWLIEAGISQVGEMARLEEMICPDTVAVTTITDAHQENFTSLEQKTAEKLILTRRARKVIYNGNCSLLAAAVEAKCADKERVDFCSYPTPEGKDNVERANMQLSAALIDALRLPAPDFKRLQPVAMRLEVKEGINNSVIVNDFYNSDINSLEIALATLNRVAGQRAKTVVLSDILQSGLSGKELYLRVAQMIEASGVDKLIGVGEEISSAAALFDCRKEFYGSTDELLRGLKRDDFAGRAVLLKGNRASRLERVSRELEYKIHTTVLEVSLDAILSNLNYYRAQLQPRVRLTAMVKAASYGAGDYEVAALLQNQGIAYLAVAFADEGITLRERGISMPIVVLNADADSFGQMVQYHLEPEIYSLHSLSDFTAAVESYGEQHYPIHVKLDTGMHRLGFDDEDVEQLCATLCAKADTIKVASIFSHLCVADDPSQDAFTRSQIALYDRLCDRIVTALGYDVVRHIAASAAMVRFPEAQKDMCRLGLGLYGFDWQHNDALQPVSTLSTRIVRVKHLAAGQTVGYGRQGVLTRESVIATIPIGYADGLDRHLGCGRWSMLVAGNKAPIVGRICMDSCMIDITDFADRVEVGDKVVVFSPEKGNTAEDMAAVLGTISYEVLTSVSSRVKRIYTKE